MKKKIGLVFIIVLFNIKVGAQVSTFKSIDSLLILGRYQEAMKCLEKLPNGFIKSKKIAAIYESLDDYKKASTYYRKALRFKDDYKTNVKLGKIYQRQKRYKDAIVVFEGILAKDAENLLVKYQLGKLYIKTKKLKKAKQVFTELIQQDAKNANYSYNLGLVYERLKKRNSKIDNFIAAYKKDNEHIKAIEKLALAYKLLRDKDSSNLFVEKGLLVNPNHINLNRLKANNLYSSKKYKETINVLQHLDTLQSNEHYTQKMLGKSYYHLNDFETAKKHFNKALKLDKEDFKSHVFLGNMYFEEEILPKAIMHFFMATMVGKEPRDKAHLGIASVFFKQKKPKRVIEQYKKAIAENSGNHKALYLLANFSDNYYKDKKIAYKHYERYMEKFESKDSVFTATAKRRIKEIKKLYFLQGEVLEY